MNRSFLPIALALTVAACSPPPIDNAAEAPADAAHEMPEESAAPYSPAADPAMNRIADKGYVLSTAMWPRNGSQPGAPSVIPVCWDDPQAEFETERAWVRDSIARSWQANANIRFVSWGACGVNADKAIRITVSDEGAHTSSRRPGTPGLGTNIRGVRRGMVLNFTFANWNTGCRQPAKRESCIRSIAVHEFGHAIGLAHEQNRPDTPGECALKAQGSQGDLMLTSWDLRSVMNYCNPEYNNGGVLSPSDVQTVRTFYGAAP